MARDAEDAPEDQQGAARALRDLRFAIDADVPTDPSVDDLDSQSAGHQVNRIVLRIRRWRDEREFTLQELARRSGVAASTIQKVEKGQMVPSIAVLVKIARGLERPLTDLVREGSDEFQVAHLPPSARNRIELPNRMTLERLVGELFEPHLEVWRITYLPGIGSGPGRFRFGGESLLLCESGELRVEVGEDVFRVRAGDTLHYKATIPHAWQNDGEVPARFVIVGTLPRSMRAALQARLQNEEGV